MERAKRREQHEAVVGWVKKATKQRGIQRENLLLWICKVVANVHSLDILGGVFVFFFFFLIK